MKRGEIPSPKRRAPASASLFEAGGYKLAEGKGLREGWDSKELWKFVEKAKAVIDWQTFRESRRRRRRSRSIVLFPVKYLAILRNST